MKQKTALLWLFIALFFLWACGSSSLLRDKSKGAKTVVSVNPVTVSSRTGSASGAAAQTATSNSTIAASDTFDIDTGMIAARIDSLGVVADTLGVVADSLRARLDSLLPPPAALQPITDMPDGHRPAHAALKRDTTTMDSLELAIYKYNMVIDDSLRLDSINRQKKNGIDSPVKFAATDSLIYEAGTGMAHLFGNAHVEYQNMDLKSEIIYMCLDSSLVHATGKLDTISGLLTGTPVFKMGNDTYENDTITFNFKTKKGLIQQVYTEQEDGFLTAEIAKRDDNGNLYLQHGKYTTCDDPHPDFYLALSRAKVRPGKDVVFGPAYLVVCDVPVPLAIPYGFFPFSKSYSSGFIMPTYGDETERGFYLRDGGYYFAISDKMDLKLIGEIYTKGSWGLSASTNYRKRYKFSGSFHASYQNTINGEKNMPDYKKQTSFKVQWSHRQDSKANPFSNLSASVNFATSSYERNNLTSMYNPQTMTQSTRTSSVSYSTTFSSIGMSLSTTMNLNQNMRDSTIAMTLPDLNISISRFYPFKRKHMVGKERWYEKISMSYTGHLSNSISTKEDKLMHSNLIKDWRNGMQHSIPVSGNFTILGYINVNPSFNLTDRTYATKFMRSWDDEANKEVVDTLHGFYNVYNWNMSVSASTNSMCSMCHPGRFSVTS